MAERIADGPITTLGQARASVDAALAALALARRQLARLAQDRQQCAPALRLSLRALEREQLRLEDVRAEWTRYGWPGFPPAGRLPDDPPGR
jgi:hypothetical protein